VKAIKVKNAYELTMEEGDLELLNNALQYLKLQNKMEDLSEDQDLLFHSMELKISRFLKKNIPASALERLGPFIFAHPENKFIVPLLEMHSMPFGVHIPDELKDHLQNLPESVKQSIIDLLES
jgi:hypothetical protein